MTTESSHVSRELEPLTQQTKNGVSYQRDPKIENEIRWALTISRKELLECLSQTKSDQTGYLKEETLVYLIRAYYTAGKSDIVIELWSALYQRCVKMIRAKIPQLDGRSEQAYQEVQADLFAQIIHPEGEQGDFLQVRFWVGFRALVISVARHLIRDRNNDRLLQPLSNLLGHELEQAEDEPEEPVLDSARITSEISGNIPIERIVIGAEGLSLLQEPLRTVFILYHGLGYLIESTDPDELTLCKIFDKSPRTIHYWLEKANKILKEWRGETDEKSN